MAINQPCEESRVENSTATCTTATCSMSGHRLHIDNVEVCCVENEVMHAKSRELDMRTIMHVWWNEAKPNQVLCCCIDTDHSGIFRTIDASNAEQLFRDIIHILCVYQTQLCSTDCAVNMITIAHKEMQIPPGCIYSCVHDPMSATNTSHVFANIACAESACLYNHCPCAHIHGEHASLRLEYNDLATFFIEEKKELLQKLLLGIEHIAATFNPALCIETKDSLDLEHAYC